MTYLTPAIGGVLAFSSAVATPGLDVDQFLGGLIIGMPTTGGAADHVAVLVEDASARGAATHQTWRLGARGPARRIIRQFRPFVTPRVAGSVDGGLAVRSAIAGPFGLRELSVV